VFSDAQRRQRASAQGNDRKKSDNQAMAIFECVRLGDALARVRTGRGMIHKLHAQRIEPLTGDEMMPRGLSWCLGGNPFGDGQQPCPIAAQTNEPDRKPKTMQVNGDR
jgi:hypothetical protein